MRALKLVLLVSTAAAVAGLAYRCVTAIQTHRALDEARIENQALMSRQVALRENAFALVERAAENVERGGRIARLAGSPYTAHDGQKLMLPPPDASSEVILGWLSERCVGLNAPGPELAAGSGSVVSKPTSAHAPGRTNATPAEDSTRPQLASMPTETRRNAAPLQH